MRQLTFIAGGSKGLGAELVNVFKQKNHQVVEFSRSGNGSAHVKVDFNQPENASKIFQQTFSQSANQQWQSINLIVNTALLPPFGSMLQAEVKTIQQHINLNVTSTMLLLKAYITAFQKLECKKTITYITSGAARRDIPGLAMYSASKAYFDRYIDTTAKEQQTCEQPIDCMIINPGVMDTDMQVEIRSQNKADFPMVDLWQELYEQGQLAKPEVIAQICFNIITQTGKNAGYYTAQDFLD